MGVLARTAFSPVRLLSQSCALGGFQLAVSHTAPTGELLTSPVVDGKGQPSQELNQYGVGVDCHSTFLQICVLIPDRFEIQKIERKVCTLGSASLRQDRGVGHSPGIRARLPSRPRASESGHDNQYRCDQAN
jgi:hypothetical protein